MSDSGVNQKPITINRNTMLNLGVVISLLGGLWFVYDLTNQWKVSAARIEGSLDTLATKVEGTSELLSVRLKHVEDDVADLKADMKELRNVERPEPGR